MGKGSVKSRARELYVKNNKITLQELKEAFPDVLDTTLHKYLIEFRKLLGRKIDAPDEISISKLEKELALQLEINPSVSVVKSCIDFLKLKQMSTDTTDELDMEGFIKRGKEISNKT